MTKASAIFPITLFIYAFLITSSIAWIILSFKNYREHFNQREESYFKALKYYEQICRDVANKEDIGASIDCNQRKEILNENPTEYALYDVLEDWNLCGREGCALALSHFSGSLMNIAIALVIFYFIVCVLCGFQLNVWRNKRNGYFNLPISQNKWTNDDGENSNEYSPIYTKNGFGNILPLKKFN